MDNLHSVCRELIFLLSNCLINICGLSYLFLVSYMAPNIIAGTLSLTSLGCWLLHSINQYFTMSVLLFSVNIITADTDHVCIACRHLTDKTS